MLHMAPVCLIVAILLLLNSERSEFHLAKLYEEMFPFSSSEDLVFNRCTQVHFVVVTGREDLVLWGTLLF